MPGAEASRFSKGMISQPLARTTRREDTGRSPVRLASEPGKARAARTRAAARSSSALAVKVTRSTSASPKTAHLARLPAAATLWSGTIRPSTPDSSARVMSSMT